MFPVGASRKGPAVTAAAKVCRIFPTELKLKCRLAARGVSFKIVSHTYKWKVEMNRCLTFLTCIVYIYTTAIAIHC